MKNFCLFLVLTSFLMITSSCKKSVKADLNATGLIPYPVELEASGTSFVFDQDNKIVVSDESLQDLGVYLKDQLSALTGSEFKIVKYKKPLSNTIFLGLSTELEQSHEYALAINEGDIEINGADTQSVFYGIQTLLQSVKYENQQKVWIVPGGYVKDYPKYEYRGMMLDVARHFFSVNDVKRLLDQMAMYKLNYLHLHLTDDQGWRIEIKSWPKLTEIGGSTAVNGDKGGFYTQEEYVNLVQYAKDRFITIVPEIDMPGHTNAALASYAELNCDGVLRELYTGTEVGFSTLCTRNEQTYRFVDDVIKELTSMTEGPYIHIGGDESHVTKADDYIYFMNRVRQIVKSHNKIMVGWDEVAHADIDGSDIVQYWAKDDNASLAVSKGSKVLMSPSKRVYLDMQYDSTTQLGLHWAAYIELDDAYNWNPVELVEGVTHDQIIGIESPLWTETITNFNELEYMVFPRLAGHAEIAWSPDELLNWESYRERLSKHSELFDRYGINYYKSPLIDWPKK